MRKLLEMCTWVSVFMVVCAMASGAQRPVPAAPGVAAMPPGQVTGFAGGGTDYYVSTTGNDTTGDGSEGNPWRTIKHAISQAVSGDTIHVASGTYVESGQIVIDKSLTIIGDPSSKPVIKPDSDTGSSGDARGWWLVNAAVVLDCENLVFDGTGRLVYQAFRQKGSGSFTNCDFREIKYNESGPDYSGLGIAAFGDGPVHVSGCTFEQIGRIGILYFGAGVAGSVFNNNVYTGKGVGDWLDYGVELGAGAVATVTNNRITNCKGVASVDGSTSAGVLITTYYGSGTAGTLMGNVLTGNTTGIATGYDSGDTSVVTANYNDLSGNDAEGIDNTSTTNTVDAAKNWWGTTDEDVIATMVDGDVDTSTPLQGPQVRLAFAGHRLISLQNNDGGWDWPLDDGDPNNASPQNTIGPIGKGLAQAYRLSGDPAMLAALQKVSAFLLAKTNTFSPSDGYLAAELDAVLGGTTHVDHLNTHFYGPLAAGTYDRNGAGTLYSTASYLDLIDTARAGQGIANLAAWDIGMGLVGAASCGVSGSELDQWIQATKDEIDELDGAEDCDVIGLAGAVYGLAFVGEDFDPTAGEHAAAGSLQDLAGILAGYQITETGGFTWNSAYVIPYQDNETAQETAYSILALREVGGYGNVILEAANWLASMQLSGGGFLSYVGGGENNEVTG